MWLHCCWFMRLLRRASGQGYVDAVLPRASTHVRVQVQVACLQVSICGIRRPRPQGAVQRKSTDQSYRID